MHYLLDGENYYIFYLFGLNAMFRHLLFARGINIEQIDYYGIYNNKQKFYIHTLYQFINIISNPRNFSAIF